MGEQFKRKSYALTAEDYGIIETIEASHPKTTKNELFTFAMKMMYADMDGDSLTKIMAILNKRYMESISECEIGIQELQSRKDTLTKEYDELVALATKSTTETSARKLGIINKDKGRNDLDNKMIDFYHSKADFNAILGYVREMEDIIPTLIPYPTRLPYYRAVCERSLVATYNYKTDEYKRYKTYFDGIFGAKIQENL